MASTELELAKDYAIVAPDTDIRETVAENLGGATLSLGDLTRITVPAGGATAWEVPTLTGMESVKEVEGVVVFWSAQRAYWKEAFAGAGVQPDCSSSDAVTGYGNPGGACADCELAKWGSAKTG